MEGLDAFAVVLAVIDFAADGLNELEGFGGEGDAAGEESELAFEGADGEGGIGADFFREVAGEAFQLGGGNQVVEDSEIEALRGRDGFCGEKHFLGFVEAEEVDEMNEAGGIVGDADFCGGHCEGSRFVADENIAGEGQVAGSAPDAAVDFGDDGAGVFLNPAQEGFQRTAIGERVASGLGQLVHIVPGGPDLGFFGGADNDCVDSGGFKFVEGLQDFRDGCLTEAIAFGRIVEGDDPDASGGFGENKIHAPKWSSAAGEKQEQPLFLKVCEGGGDDGEGFFQICREVPGAEESGFELGGGKIDAGIQAGVEKSCEGTGVAAFGIGEIRDGTCREEEAKHRADAVKGERFIFEERTQPFFEEGAGFFEEFPTAGGFQGFELGQSCGKREGIAAESARLIDRARGSEVVHDFRTPAEGTDWEAAADDLAHCGEVGANAKNLLRSAGSEAEPRHDLIENEDGSILGAEFTESLQKARVREIEAGVGGDRFEDDGGEFATVVCKEGAEGFCVVEREGRGECCEGGGDAGTVRLSQSECAAACFDQQGIDMAVVAALELENAVASSETPGEAQTAHGRLGAAVDHAHFFK